MDNTWSQGFHYYVYDTLVGLLFIGVISSLPTVLDKYNNNQILTGKMASRDQNSGCSLIWMPYPKHQSVAFYDEVVQFKTHVCIGDGFVKYTILINL